jgi:hypothetical protein
LEISLILGPKYHIFKFSIGTGTAFQVCMKIIFSTFPDRIPAVGVSELPVLSTFYFFGFLVPLICLLWSTVEIMVERFMSFFAVSFHVGLKEKVPKCYQKPDLLLRLSFTNSLKITFFKYIFCISSVSFTCLACIRPWV